MKHFFFQHFEEKKLYYYGENLFLDEATLAWTQKDAVNLKINVYDEQLQALHSAEAEFRHMLSGAKISRVDTWVTALTTYGALTAPVKWLSDETYYRVWCKGRLHCYHINTPTVTSYVSKVNDYKGAKTLYETRINI